MVNYKIYCIFDLPYGEHFNGRQVISEFKLFIDHALYNVLAFKVTNTESESTNTSTFELLELVVEDVKYAVITNKNVVLEDICGLGRGMFSTMSKWNLIAGQQPSDAPLLGDIAFNDFEYNYGLIDKIKEVNGKIGNILVIPGVSVFNTSVNNQRQFEVVDKYNFQFNTNFEVLTIADHDGVGFATIRATDVNLIDVLGLGFMICLDDVLKSDLSSQY
jgi:hypothetical protein